MLPYKDPAKHAQWNASWRARNSEKMRTARRIWKKAHRGVENALEKERRARKLGQVCTCCSREKFQAIYDVAKMFGDEVDHIKPLALGGLHCRHNLQLLSPAQHRLKTVADLAAIKFYRSVGA